MILHTASCLSSGLSLSLTLVSSRRCNIRAIGASDVRYSRCRNRARVGLSVGISVTVSVPSNKVRVVIVLTKNAVEIISLVL